MKASETTNDVQIQRTFNAPVQHVWDMWTKPENFRKWYGPDGATIPTAEMDVRVDGKRRIEMEIGTANGLMSMWFAGEYLVVMADKDGNHLAPSAMGMPGDKPEITTVTIELKDMGGNMSATTQMIMTHVGVPAGSPGEMGWNMAFGKLEKLL